MHGRPTDKLTMVLIADRLEEAAYTLRRLPKVTVEGFKSNWPPTVNEFHEAYGYNEVTVRLGPPSARHITEMDEALLWLHHLPPSVDMRFDQARMGCKVHLPPSGFAAQLWTAGFCQQ